MKPKVMLIGKEDKKKCLNLFFNVLLLIKVIYG
jgi:hypothetical protein